MTSEPSGSPGSEVSGDPIPDSAIPDEPARLTLSFSTAANALIAAAPPRGPSRLEPGSAVKHYEIIRELGQGGMGRVYLARDTKLGRLCAIKLLLGYSGGLAGRFLAEARATARCKHENIVVLYEVDEIRGTPYMVLEYLEGRTLRAFLSERAEPVPARLAAEIVIPVARALACAHGMGIVHLDLKPENIVLTESGPIKVLDFGVARQLGPGEIHEGTPGGTRPYMSPEQWLGKGIDAQSDIWAAGILLHELFTGSHPLAPVTPARLEEIKDLDTPIPGVRERRADAGALGALIDRCLAKPKSARVASAAALLAELESIAADSEGRAAPVDAAPFTGLAAFQESDAARFFGRERDQAVVLRRLQHQPLVVVAGPSGAGKSSFVRAGVIAPWKRSGGQREAFLVRPGRQPLAALAELLARVLEPEAGAGETGAASNVDLAATLRDRPGDLGARLRARCREGRDHRIVLFVDQLEELHTLGASAEERTAFLACLLGAADDASSPLRVVLSIRSDFLDRMAEDRPFMDAATRGLFFLSPMTRDDLRAALVRPLEATGHRFESPDMVNAMLDALATTAIPLPLLQFTATRLWELRDVERRLLTRESHDRIGGVAGALATHADSVMAGMTDREQRLARAIHLRLVTPERTRAVVGLPDLRELDEDGDAVEAVVSRLADARLLSIEAADERAFATVELVHESLIERWPRLGRWLEENQEETELLGRVAPSAKQWEASGCPEGLLWRGDAAEDAKRWLRRHGEENDTAFGPRERRFIAAVAALDARERRRRGRLVAAVIAGLSAVVVIVSVLAVLARRAAIVADAEKAEADRAQREADVARQNALDAAIAASDARLLAGFREMKNAGQLAHATKLLLEVQRPASARGWIALASDALDSNMLEATLRGHERAIHAAAWSPDGKRVVTASADGTARIWSADGRGDPVLLRGHEGPVRAAAWSPDGERVITGSDDRTARLWSAERGELRATLEGHPGPVVAVAFSPDGDRVVTASDDGTARLWSASGAGDPVVVHGHTPGLLAVAPSPDGRRVVTTSRDKTARIWDTSGEGVPVVLRGHTGSVLAAAWSPDGERVVTGSSDRTARIWRADGKGEVVVLEGHSLAVTSVAFRPDGRHVATASLDQTARVWSAEGGAPLVHFNQEAPIGVLAWSPDGERVITAASEQTGRTLDHAARIWRPTSLLGVPRKRRHVHHSASFSADGELVVNAYADERAPAGGKASYRRAARLQRVDGKGDPVDFEGHGAWIASAAPSPDGTRVVTASFDGTARVHRAGDPKDAVVLSGHAAAVRAAVWSPDGTRIVTVSDDKTAMVRRADGTGEPVILADHRDGLTSAAWSPDGSRIVTGSMDHTARIWRADGTGSPLVLAGHGAPVQAVAFSPDGRRVATASSDTLARIWDIESGAVTTSLAHASAVVRLLWSPDGKLLATSSVKGGLQLWNVDQPEEPIYLEPAVPALSMVFLDGGRRILAALSDNTSRTWTIDVDELKKRLAESNVDCLPWSLRTIHFGETAAKARDEYTACERRRGRTPPLLDGGSDR